MVKFVFYFAKDHVDIFENSFTIRVFDLEKQVLLLTFSLNFNFGTTFFQNICLLILHLFENQKLSVEKVIVCARYHPITTLVDGIWTKTCSELR